MALSWADLMVPSMVGLMAVLMGASKEWWSGRRKVSEKAAQKAAQSESQKVDLMEPWLAASKVER